jgi:hypothetical protein
MATIRSYDNDATINPQDKLIGSDGSTGVDNGKTKNYTISSLRNFILDGPSLSNIVDAADDTAAATAGIAVGGVYRTGSTLKIRIE